MKELYRYILQLHIKNVLTKDDDLFFIATFLITYLYTSFWDNLVNLSSVFIAGPSWVSFFISVYLFFRFSNRRTTKYKKIDLLILTTGVYILIRVIGSLFNDLKETVEVLKYGYIQGLSLMLLLPYIRNLTKEKILALFKLNFIITCIQIILYFLQVIGLSVFEHFAELDLTNITIHRYILGLPFTQFLWPITLSFYYKTKSRLCLIYTILSILCIVISFTRMILFSTILMGFSISLFFIIKGYKSVFLKMTIGTMICIGTLMIITPTIVVAWEEHIDKTVNEDLKEDTGTRFVRALILASTFEKLKAADNEMFGFGYKRDFDSKRIKLDATNNIQSIVYTNDTSMPGILYTEGYVGLILRYLPIVALCYNALTYLLRKKRITIENILCIIILTTVIIDCYDILFSSIYKWYLFCFIYLLLYHQYIKTSK